MKYGLVWITLHDYHHLVKKEDHPDYQSAGELSLLSTRIYGLSDAQQLSSLFSFLGCPS
jgi:hypothetical protein